MAKHDNAAEPAKPESNRLAELVRPVTPLPAQVAVEPPSLADLVGMAHHSPGLDDHAAIELAGEEKSWVQKEIERDNKAGTGGSGGGGQSWQERVRILPVEQQQEKENEREL